MPYKRVRHSDSAINLPILVIFNTILICCLDTHIPINKFVSLYLNKSNITHQFQIQRKFSKGKYKQL